MSWEELNCAGNNITDRLRTEGGWMYRDRWFKNDGTFISSEMHLVPFTDEEKVGIKRNANPKG